MPRAKDIAWKFVIRLEGEKWRCPHCENEYSGKVTRVKSHLLKHPNKGIAPCKKVPEHIMDLLQNQVGNTDDIAWKFVNRLEDNKWRCHYCSAEFFGDLRGVKGHLLEEGPYEGISICTEVPDHVRTLMRSLLDEVAEEEGREATGQSSTEPKSRDVPAPAEVAEGESREADRQISTGPQSRDMLPPAVLLPPQSFENVEHSLTTPEGATDMANFTSDQQQGEHQFHPSLTMPSPVQNSHATIHTSVSQQPSCHWQTGSDAAAIHPQHHLVLPPGEGSLDDLDISWQPNQSHRSFDAEHGDEIALLLQQSSMDWLASLSPDSNHLPQLFDQSVNLDIGNRQQHPRASSSLQIDRFLNNSASNVLHELTGPTGSSKVTTAGIPQRSNQPYPNFDEHHILNSPYQPQSSIPSLYPEDMQMNDQQTPIGASSFQYDQLPAVGNSNCLQDCNQHSQFQTTMDIDRSIASQHTSDSHSFEATTVDLQVPEAARNATGPSSSLDMNRGSPIMNVRSIYANNEEMRNLKRKVEELDVKEAVIKEQMEIEGDASSVRKKPRILVEKWMKEKERARNNFQIIGQANGETLPPKEEVETLTREVEELIEQTLPQPLLIEARDAKGDAFLERKLMGEAIHRNIELIWNHLKENHVCKLGIYGMGGVGKTTIMMHIHNRLLKDATFDGVLFITVSQDFSIYKLQSDIWKALKFGVMEDEHEKKRAARLSEHLERKKNCVLILDDAWQHFKLQDVGIPDRAGLKVVLTTRFSEVCSRTDCEEIKIEPLGEEEAWTLFVEELGLKPLTSKQVEKVARKIAKRCAGLPLAINTMASSLRGEKNFFVWQDTLNKLERSHTEHTEMEDKVLSVLRLSYERLSDPRVKQCFLFFALFPPEDKRVKQMKLIEYFIDEGFLDELDTREAQYYRGLAIVEMLRNACLLEVAHDYVKMHDLIREMALCITSTSYMVKAGRGWKRLPDGEYWTEDLEKVSLMQGWIEDFPSDMSPNCPKLSTLLLNCSFRLDVQIQDSFFMNLRGLKVLNLSKCSITELPDSLSELANLQALLLRYCGSLCRLPYLGKLKSLRKLDAHGCESLLAIEGLEELRNLRYLDLSNIGIKSLLEGTLRRMVNLQYLKIAKTVKVKAEEVIQLKALERLECNFGNVDDFNKYMRFIERSGRHDYELIVDQKKSLWLVTAYVYYDLEILPENRIKFYGHDYTTWPKSVDIRSCNYDVVSAGGERNNDSILIPGDVEVFVGTNCRGMTNLSGMGLLRCLGKLVIIEWDDLTGVLFGGAGVDEEVRNTRDSPTCLFPSLEMLWIKGCSKLKYLFGYESRFSLPLLREVFLYGCKGIRGMTASVASPSQLGGPAFPRLECIEVWHCDNMKRVVGSEWLPHFPNLTDIVVGQCKGIEEIISGGGENHGGSAPLNTPSSSLPSPFSPLKLKKLWLEQLPRLKSIGEGGISFIPGAIVRVYDCPKLNRSLNMLRTIRAGKILQIHQNMLHRSQYPDYFKRMEVQIPEDMLRRVRAQIQEDSLRRIQARQTLKTAIRSCYTTVHPIEAQIPKNMLRRLQAQIHEDNLKRTLSQIKD